MNAIPKLELTLADLVRLRIGDIRKVEADDGTPVLVVLNTSPSRHNITWKHRVVVSAGDLDRVEEDPQAGQIVTAEGLELRFHLVGGNRT